MNAPRALVIPEQWLGANTFASSVRGIKTHGLTHFACMFHDYSWKSYVYGTFSLMLNIRIYVQQ